MKGLILIVLFPVFLVGCGSSPAPIVRPPTAVTPTAALATGVPKATEAPKATTAPTTAPTIAPTAASASKATEAPKATAPPTAQLTSAPQATTAPTLASAALPAGWTVQQTGRFSIALPQNYTVSSPSPFTAIDSATFATVSVIDTPTISGKIQTIVDTAVKTLTPGSKVLKSQTDVVINGKQAGLLEYDISFGTGASTTHSLIVNYYILSGSDEFDLSISGGKLDDATFIPTAEKIGNSFTVKK